jgi:hypothetical protein
MQFEEKEKEKRKFQPESNRINFGFFCHAFFKAV